MKNAALKWRLAWILDKANKRGSPLGGQYALGWAAFKLSTGRVRSGLLTKLPDRIRQRTHVRCKEVRVIVYDDTAQMLEPMDLQAYERRLEEVAQHLPSSARVVRVPFHAALYRRWLGKRLDTHEKRAEWANQLEDLDL